MLNKQIVRFASKCCYLKGCSRGIDKHIRESWVGENVKNGKHSSKRRVYEGEIFCTKVIK